MRADFYRTITDQIIAAIEAGTGDYQLPWHRGGTGTPLNAITGRHYRGVNTLMLWAAAMQRGYATGEWATYRQLTAAGAQVRKGEQATVVLLWKTVAGANDHDGGNGDDQGQPRMLARAFRVFNAAQVDGYTVTRPQLPLEACIGHAETFFAALPAEVFHDSNDAFYDPASDNVFLPSFHAFRSAQSYYSVYAHELTHWTGAKHRLNRDLSGRFGSAAYAIEELVADLGAAFVVGHLGLAAAPREDHACYIASWLKVLADDPRAIVIAASRAQAAADYLIHQFDPEAPPAAEASAELEQAA